MLLEGADTPRLLFLISSFLSICGYLVSFICLPLLIVPRHSIDGGGILGPDDLVRAGFEVTRRRDAFDVRVAKYSVLRMYEGGHAFRCLPTSTAIWAIVLLFMAPQLTIIVFLIALYVHHGCCKGLRGMPVRSGAPAPEERSVEEIIGDSLMGAYMLAREAADVRRSSYNDHALILVILALVAWVALLAICAPDLIEHGSFAWLGLGTLVIVAATAIGVLILRERRSKDVAREETWAKKLLSVIREEEGAGSPIELLLCACQEVPIWLEVRRRGIWSREPGRTLLIFILLNVGVGSMLQYSYIWWGYFFIGMVCLAFGIFLFSYQIVSARFESREIAGEWERKMGEMDSLLESGRGR